LSTAARQLIEAALERELSSETAATDRGLVSLAGLVAAEHAALMVAAVLPDGERRLRDLAPRAAAAAEERLAMFREAGS
jgi:hypothetical protein